MGSTIQMYVAAAPSDNLASIDVPNDGVLTGVDWSVAIAASGADFSDTLQLSFGSTSTLAVNDSRASISNCTVASDVTTSGAAVTHANKYVALPDLPVAMGERIYIHGTGTAITITARVVLHFSFSMSRARERLR